MRLLLDECVPRPGIGVVLAVARTNRVKELRVLVPQILAALAAVKPGELVTAGG